MPEETQAGLPRHRLVGLALGPMAAFAMLLGPAPGDLSPQGWATAAVGTWMAIWWMTEALPLAVTALLPLVLFPMLAGRGVEETAAPYANPLVFLFLGGFLMARAMHVWKLDRRLALAVLRLAGTRPRRVIAGMMVVTAFLSMWVSNTATAMVMLPIALSILPALQSNDTTQRDGFAPALLLGIAYSATIGGMGTIIGTPPNALFVAYMAESHGVTIDFWRWMLIGVPAVLVMLPLAWVVLTYVAFRVADVAAPSASLPPQAGPMTRAERMLAVLMVAIAMCWIFRPLLNDFLPLSDAGIAIAGAILCFLLPVDFKGGRFLLSWDEAMDIRWDVLILFGGGLSLAAAIADTDLATWLGAHLTGLGTLHVFLLLLVIGVLIVGVGELASNTAMAAVFLPVAGATALAMGEPAFVLALPVALFATLGFMLPVGTPPNAVIFGSGAVRMNHMLRAGIILDVVGIFIVAGLVLVLGEWVLAP